MASREMSIAEGIVNNIVTNVRNIDKMIWHWSGKRVREQNPFDGDLHDAISRLEDYIKDLKEEFNSERFTEGGQ